MKKTDIYWPVTFFSTAFGAGIFYLPQTVGPRIIGIRMFFIYLIISMLISAITHSLFYRFISIHQDRNYLKSTALLIGDKASKIVSGLFILSMQIIILINFLTLDNIYISFFKNNIITRLAVSLILSTFLSLAWLMFNKKIERFIAKIALLTILMTLLIATSLYFQKPEITQPPINGNYLNSFRVSLLPVLLFTFNFTPCIQRFSKSSERINVKAIIIGTGIIAAFICLITISLSQHLNFNDLILLRQKNLDSLFYTTKLTNNQYLTLISILLMTLITCGAYVGTLTGVMDGVLSFGIKKIKPVLLANIIFCTLVGTLNPAVIKIISQWSMPIIIGIVYIIPSIYFLTKKAKNYKYESIIVLMAGLIMLYGIYF
ncbi:threonine/serine transporter (plasmid) [Salmonella enterica subsp. enterica serovar Karamoja]|uniref:Threonine/serine transporter n=1 Tax=Salmonella enterica subsp. enterica serovar Karamoja TaxID=2500153 RepID=A0A3Q9MUG1_SALET|nr:threonine/serine transporter [Salmonella enterica]AZT39642.1 threonine/serine transporter [Salmonella enterica subsp. enterica serovar Karamoja]AZT44465.1 threonine/serine transporter [Salmonella enterica subsp. enterica serovar Karamoja]